jgi:hypothetical protein
MIEGSVRKRSKNARERAESLILASRGGLSRLRGAYAPPGWDAVQDVPETSANDNTMF